MKILTFILLTQVYSIFSLDDALTNNTFSVPSNYTILENTNSVVKLNIFLNENVMPKFIIDTINSEFLIKNTSKITIKDVIKLARLDDITLLEASELLKKLDVLGSSLINFENLEYIYNLTGISVYDFANALFSELGVSPLDNSAYNNLLEPFNLTSAQYMVGNYQKNVSLFQNFNYEKLLLFINKTQRQADVVFNSFRNLLAAKIPQLNETLIKNIWKGFDVVRILKASNISLENIYKVDVFTQMLNDISNNELSTIKALGVLTGTNKLTINKKTYELWKNRSDIIKIVAQSTIDATNITVKPEEGVTQRSANVFELTTNTNVSSFVIPERVIEDIKFSTYVTLKESNLTSTVIPLASVNLNDELLAIPRNSTLDFILGGALISNGRLIGLASGENSTHLILDLLYNQNDSYVPSSASTWSSRFGVTLMALSAVILHLFNGFE